MNENLIAALSVLGAIGLAALGLDDGSLVRMVVTAFLGFLLGKKVQESKGGDSD